MFSHPFFQDIVQKRAQILEPKLAQNFWIWVESPFWKISKRKEATQSQDWSRLSPVVTNKLLLNKLGLV